MFSNKLHPFIAEKQKKQGVFVSGKNENLDPRSVHSSVIGHACHAAAEASLSVLFVPVTSGSGWMKPGAQEARRLRWGVYFVSHSWFYFSTTGGRLIEELGRRGEGGRGDWYHCERLGTPTTWASAHSSWRRRSLPWGVQGLWQKEWSGSFVSVSCSPVLLLPSEFLIKKTPERKERDWEMDE